MAHDWQDRNEWFARKTSFSWWLQLACTIRTIFSCAFYCLCHTNYAWLFYGSPSAKI